MQLTNDDFNIKMWFVKISAYRVKVGILFALLYISFASPTYYSFIYGIPFIMLGEAIRIWASGHIIKGLTLTVSGPYSYSRHPLYLGSIIIAIGFTIIANSPIIIGLMILYFFFFYTPTILKEETTLKEKFSESFSIYKELVSLFISKENRWYLPGKFAPFKLSRFLHNRENDFIIVIFIIIIILFFKMKYF